MRVDRLLSDVVVDCRTVPLIVGFLRRWILPSDVVGFDLPLRIAVAIGIDRE